MTDGRGERGDSTSFAAVTPPPRVRQPRPAASLEAQRQAQACANGGKKHVPWDNCGHIADVQVEARRFHRLCPFAPSHIGLVNTNRYGRWGALTDSERTTMWHSTGGHIFGYAKINIFRKVSVTQKVTLQISETSTREHQPNKPTSEHKRRQRMKVGVLI